METEASLAQHCALSPRKAADKQEHGSKHSDQSNRLETGEVPFNEHPNFAHGKQSHTAVQQPADAHAEVQIQVLTLIRPRLYEDQTCRTMRH